MLSAARSLLFRLPAYEGPLDLLLQLIRKSKVDIYDIPIAEITRQYMATVELWQSMDLAVAGEYLVMAATLVEIKSRLLLPAPPPAEGDDTEEDPRAELVRRLVEYERYASVVDGLKGLESYRRDLYFRAAMEDPEAYLLPVPEAALDGRALLAALQRALEAAGVKDALVTAVVPRRRLSLRMKMAEVLRRLRSSAEGALFSDFFEIPCQRYEIVLLFLAVLELLRVGKVRAVQRNPLSDIRLTAVQEAA